MTLPQFLHSLPDLYFNSHPHEEDDLQIRKRMSLQSHFNSHPHEEDDIADYALRLLIAISTHILTKRMTFRVVCLNHVTDISTHILTKRMTLLFKAFAQSSQYFNSHPHEEDDNHSSFLSKDN